MSMSYSLQYRASMTTPTIAGPLDGCRLSDWRSYYFERAFLQPVNIRLHLVRLRNDIDESLDFHKLADQYCYQT